MASNVECNTSFASEMHRGLAFPALALERTTVMFLQNHNDAALHLRN